MFGPQNLSASPPGRDNLNVKDCEESHRQPPSPSIKGHHLGLMLRTLSLGLIKMVWL